MKHLWKVCALSSLFLLPMTVSCTPSLPSTVNSKAESPQKAALEQELSALKEQRLKYAHWARYADNEANRLMSRDWIEYQEYLRMQRNAQEKVDLIDVRCQQIEKELASMK